MISAIILTFNSADVISQTLQAARRVAEQVIIVDSFSTDKTVNIAKDFGVAVFQHPFENYAAQRNWAIESIPTIGEWQLHLDSDELLSDQLIDEIMTLKRSWPRDITGFYIPRLIRFLGRDLRHGGFYPIYHMRLFRKGCAHLENRLYDQHFILQGRGKKLSGAIIDDNRMSLSEWTARHNRWSDLEVEEILSQRAEYQIIANPIGGPIEKKRFQKYLYYRTPLMVRPFFLFFYRYILRAGFLDGVPGLIYCGLQTFWFRFLVDSKIIERRRERAK